MSGPHPSRIETNVLSNSIPLLQASPQKIILQQQTSLETAAFQLTTPVISQNHTKPQLVAVTSAPKQFPGQVTFPMVQQTGSQLIPKPANPIIQQSSNPLIQQSPNHRLSINLDYLQEFPPSDVISINGIPYVRQDQISNQVVCSKAIFQAII